MWKIYKTMSNVNNSIDKDASELEWVYDSYYFSFLEACTHFDKTMIRIFRLITETIKDKIYTT